MRNDHNRNRNRNVPFDINRPSPFTTESSFPPLLPDHNRTFSWSRVSFGRSTSSQPIRLSVLRLDGSSFDIVVKKKATVAKVKQAVEAAFSHLPKHGDDKISWSYVWGHFCLCFEHMKLLRDRDPITRYNIKNGDQLQFVRHTPYYIVAGERLERLDNVSNETEGSSSNSGFFANTKKEKYLVKNEVNQCNGEFGGNEKCRPNWAGTMSGLLSRRRKEGRARGNGRRVANSTIRLGQIVSSDDENSDERRDNSCKSSAYLPNSLNDYVGGFSYPTGYCLK